MLPVNSLRRFDLGDGRENYRHHGDDQIAALGDSLDEFGQYKPIVVSSDRVVLAGEGVWLTHQAKGLQDIACVVMPFGHEDPRAEKLLVVDNETSRLAQDDDKVLATLLASIQQSDAAGLAGTGYTDGELDGFLGSLTEHEFAVGDPADPITKEQVDRRWFVGFVLDEQHKRALADIIGTNQLPGEAQHETLSRLVVAKIVSRT